MRGHMLEQTVVTTGSRLHFGFFAHGRPSGRQFGGVGVMINRPGFVLRATPAIEDELECGIWHDRVATLLPRLRSGASQESRRYTGPLRIEILEAPPAHAGLGSGTQLALAVAKACSVLVGEQDCSAAELARRAGRGRRSALGLHGFQYGGLLVEGGKRTSGEIGPLVARIEFPQEWRFVLVRPREAAGVSGADEVGRFARLIPMPQALTDRLCRIALMEIVPAAIERDFGQASESIGQFGRLVGEYFAPVQGGVFADERMRRLADAVISQNLRGIGQTSWGPTLFILCPGAEFARDLAADLAARPAGAACEFTIAEPLNRGASVETL